MKESMEEITHFDLNITYTKGEKVCYNNKYWEYWPNEKQAPYSLAVFPSNETGWRLEKEKTTPEEKAKRLSQHIVDNLKGGSDEYKNWPEMTEVIENKIVQLIELSRKEERENCRMQMLNQIESDIEATEKQIKDSLDKMQESIAKDYLDALKISRSFIYHFNFSLKLDKEGEGNE